MICSQFVAPKIQGDKAIAHLAAAAAAAAVAAVAAAAAAVAAADSGAAAAARSQKKGTETFSGVDAAALSPKKKSGSSGKVQIVVFEQMFFVFMVCAKN